MLKNIIIILLIIILLFFISNDEKVNNFISKKYFQYLFIFLIVFFIYKDMNLFVILILIIIFVATNLNLNLKDKMTNMAKYLDINIQENFIDKKVYEKKVDGKKIDNNIDMNKIQKMESSGNPNAVSSKGAVGLEQVTKPALADFNKSHNTNLSMDDMKNPDKNKKVGDWYMNVQIPRMLRQNKIPVTKDNILRAYNEGVGNLKKHKVFKETEDYVRKYNQ